MKILLDECTPRLLKRRLTGFDVRTVQEMGWAGITNGELLRRAEDQFDVLVTSDQNLRYQQNLAGRRLAIIQLPTNEVPVVAQLLSAVEESLNLIKPGEFVDIPLP